MQEEEAGKNLSARGQSKEPEISKLWSRVHGQHASRAGGPAEAEGYEPRQQRVPAHAYAATSDILKEGLKGRQTVTEIERKDIVW